MEDLRQRGNLTKYGEGKFKPFGKHTLSSFSTMLHELRPVFNDVRFRRIIWLGLINTACLFVLLKWCHVTRSMGLRSYTYLIFFDILCLCICALSIWVEQKKPNQHFTFGYERYEVLAIFLSTTSVFVSSFFLMKKSIERWIHQPHIHTGRYFPGIVLAFTCHMIVTYCMKNKGLNLVICASSSSFLQRYIVAISQNLCRNIPGLSTIVLARFNPFVLVGWTAAATLMIAQIFIDIYDYHCADSIAAILIAFMMCVTMFPMCTYSAKILLQGTPPHIADLLDKCLREASTLDGVLEFRNEHFWLLGYDKIVGSVHVRIRRDANEQVVLGHLMGKLSSLVSDITIQVFKDEWAWSSSTLQILNESFMKFPPSSTLPPSSLQSQSTNPQTPLLNFNSTSSSNSHAKLPYSGLATNPEAKTTYNLPQSPYISLPPSLPRPPVVRHARAADCSISISNIENTSSLAATQSEHYSALRSYQAANTPRSSRTDLASSDRSRNISINPLLSVTPDFLKSYKS